MDKTGGIVHILIFAVFAQFGFAQAYAASPQSSCDLALATIPPEVTDPFYFMRGLSPTPTELVEKRYRALCDLHGEFGTVPKFEQVWSEPGISTVKTPWPGGRLLFAGDIAIEEPNIAQGNVEMKEYIFNPSDNKLREVRPISVGMAEALSGDLVNLIRIMSADELEAWEDADIDYLSVAGPAVSPSEGSVAQFGERAIWLSVSIPIFHSVQGTEMISIQVPKSKLVEWSEKHRAIFGQLHGSDKHLLEVAITESAWKDLSQFFVGHSGTKLDLQVSARRKKERSLRIGDLAQKQAQIKAARLESLRHNESVMAERKATARKEFPQEMAKVRFTPLETALNKSGLSPAERENLKTNSKGFLSVEQYLREGGLEGGYAVGMREGLDTSEVLSSMKRMNLYGGSNISKEITQENFREFFEKLILENKPLVVFFPNDIQNEVHTQFEAIFEWLKNNPEKLGNTQFVFGGYDLFNYKQQQIFGALGIDQAGIIQSKSSTLKFLLDHD